MPEAPAPAMRLDRFLWFTRLAKTRSAAQAIAAEGRMRIDGRAVDRAHAAVRVGNVLTFICNGRVRVVRVAALPPRRGPAPEAQLCYAEVQEGRVSDTSGEVQEGAVLDAPGNPA